MKHISATKILQSLLIGFAMVLMLGSGSDNLVNAQTAAYCSPSDLSTPSFLPGLPCIACLPPNPSHSCGGDQYSCCEGIGTDNNGNLHCDVSGNPNCGGSVPTPTPQQQCPTNLTVTCSNSGPDVRANFSWDESDADRYILRVNREDGEDPEWVSTNDHWYYVDDTVGSCNGTNCTALLDNSTPKSFIEGNYLGWSVQSYYGPAGSGESGCQVEGGPFSCTMPDADFTAACTPDQQYGALSYTLSVDNVTNASNPFTSSTFFLNTTDNQAYAADLRAYLGSPTWSSGNWQGYFLGRVTSLSTTNPPTIDYTWSTANSSTIGSNQRTVDDLANWMQANYTGTDLQIGANIVYNNVQNDWIGSVNLSIAPSACVEGEGWGVDNVSVCWDGSTLGASDVSNSGLASPSEVTIRPIKHKRTSTTSFINRVLSAVSKAL